MKTEFRIFESS